MISFASAGNLKKLSVFILYSFNISKLNFVKNCFFRIIFYFCAITNL